MVSKLNKRWQLAAKITDDFKVKFPEINPVILQLLYNRGLTEQKTIDEFLFADYTSNLYDPFLFKDMAKAVERIYQAIESGEKITVHGDYDADGVSAAVILVSTIRALGGKVGVYLPHREKEGYGVNMKTIRFLKKEKTSLIITCDCGISNWEEIEEASKLGMEVIITDHHHVPEKIPAVLAILHPKLPASGYPYENLTGGGVAFKLAQALCKKDARGKKVLPDGFDKWLLDLVAISTVADFGPLQGENRTLVEYGLIVLQKTKRLGLLKLYEKAGIDRLKINSETIGWQIAPRINAAGRLDHANAAYELLISEDKDEAEKLAESLNKSNNERQALTEKITAAALAFVGEPKDKIVIAVGKDWPLGVIGLVAGKLANKFHRPAFVLGDSGKQIVGSARSPVNFHLTEALDKLNKHLARYGGHSGAAGFTVKNKKELEPFIDGLKSLANAQIKDEDLIKDLHIDAEISLDDVNWDFFEQLEKFEPCGEANPRPLFLARDLIVENIQAIGKDSNHLRLMMRHRGNKIFKIIGFCFADEDKVGENWCGVLKKGDKADVVLDIGVNEWNGNRELQFKMVDIQKI
ncbi:MAG: single-stranded-DNA-specific exonuclease RecJ [Patescibacteria group bacterium]|nr:single-stranded-DNA-specific exonuclease RecJ [Patescibacteria group bacterium]MDD5490606.1 single-stranded-DNA-specific exonuclease RecJ [Patescibacteria group bacterium]